MKPNPPDKFYTSLIAFVAEMVSFVSPLPHVRMRGVNVRVVVYTYIVLTHSSLEKIVKVPLVFVLTLINDIVMSHLTQLPGERKRE